MAMLQVVYPFSFILCSIQVRIDSITMRFIFMPFSIIHVTICMPEFASTIGFVVPPVTLILGPVRPYLHPVPLSVTIFPLTLVDGTTFKNELFLVFETRFIEKQLLLDLGRFKFLTRGMTAVASLDLNYFVFVLMQMFLTV